MSNGHLIGDKVGIKAGPHRGTRGLVKSIGHDALLVAITGGDTEVPLDAVTNYSLAARRAWETRPKRAGRPRLASPRKRMISVRIDIDVLDAMAVLAERGAISNREQAINDWLRCMASHHLAASEQSD